MNSLTHGQHKRRDWLQRLAVAPIARPRTTVGLWLAMALVASIGVAKLDVDTATSSFLDRNDPRWDFYEKSVAQFGEDEFILVVLEGDEPFEEATLNRVLQLSRQFKNIKGIRRIDSVATTPSVTLAGGQTLQITPALLETIESKADAEQVAAIVRRDRLASKLLVSTDERAFAMYILLDEIGAAEPDRVVDAVGEVIGEINGWHSGVPVFRTQVNQHTAFELAVYVPATVALIYAVLLIAFESPAAAAVALFSAGVGTWIVLATMGLAGDPISLSTMMLPSIMLALGCAYVAHVLAGCRRAENKEELEGAVLLVSRPVALSGLTTTIGFLAMAIVPIDAIRELGGYGSIGVVVVLCAALTLGPALMRVRKCGFSEARVAFWISNRLVNWLMVVVRERQKEVIFLWIVAASVFAFGIPRLTVDTDIIRWFSRSTSVRQSYEAIRSRISGITPLNVVIEGKGEQVVTDPAALQVISDLGMFVSGLPEVSTSLSIADVVDQIHREMERDSGRDLVISRDLVEQYLGMVGSVDYLRDLISDDRQMTNFLIRSNENGSSNILALAGRIERWWQENGLSEYRLGVTGIMYEFGRAEDAIAYGQIRGLGLALGAIIFVFVLLLGSLQCAVAAVIPNLLPVVIVYGSMGFLGMPLDAATLCVGSLALGIAVDDTIHVGMGWRSGREVGDSFEGSIEDTFRRVLFPLVVTTGAILSGFLVLGISDFTLVRHFGLVTAAVVSLCLLADLTLLPALLKWAGGSR